MSSICTGNFSYFSELLDIFVSLLCEIQCIISHVSFSDYSVLTAEVVSTKESHKQCMYVGMYNSGSESNGSCWLLPTVKRTRAAGETETRRSVAHL